MKKASASLKRRDGQQLYEPWMDYKEDTRVSTLEGTPPAPAGTAQTRYRFNNEYAESVSTPSVASISTKRAPPLIRTPSRTPSSRKSTPKPTSAEQMLKARLASADRPPSKPKPSSADQSTSKQPPSRGQSVPRTRSIARTPPPPYTTKADYSNDQKLIGKIEFEFKAFYTWTTNGTEDDLTTKHIETLLFPNL
ncbi:hypothetical protein RB195_020026 [Necator americanus]|uniref:Uncharacterized protein n=1 Tax=Necator americanus TaxID=51031 RepID=A0ABR1CGV1_NECAM